MAYLRGSTYIWSDGTNLHVWSEDQPDDSIRPEAYNSAIAIPESLADQFAVMRFAELMKLGLLDKVIDQALESGNFGSSALAGLAPLLRQLGSARKLTPAQN